MKKVFLLAIAGLMVTGIAFAENGKKKKSKGKKSCTKGGHCCEKKATTATM